MLSLLLALQLGAAPLTPDAVVEAMGEPGCPRLFDLLAPGFQKAVPKEQWAGFCNSLGRLTDLRPQPEKKNGMDVFRAKGASGDVELQLGLTSEGKIGGLMVKPWVESAKYTSTELAPLLQEIIAARHVPALGALAMVNGKVVTFEVAGVRKQGDATAVTKADVWHLGSDTKAMTAMLAAMVVDSGKWKWSTTVPELFPKLKVDPGFKSVTLAMLLRHRAGLVPNITVWPLVGTRQGAVADLLAKPPQNPGTFVYSNAGYVTIGAALELALGKPWETLMREKLFAPLEMRSCGFGVMAHGPKVDQPWPHAWKDGHAEPVFADAHADNPAALGPAGTVSCSLTDWAKFAEVFASGDGKGLITPASLAELQRAEGTYAGGWLVQKFEWAEGPGLAHSGSNTMNFCTALISPSAHAVFLGVSNVAGAGDAAINDALQFVTKRYAPAHE